MKNISKRLWYKQPAKEWNEALPIGNGRLGGMFLVRFITNEYNLMRILSGTVVQEIEIIQMH